MKKLLLSIILILVISPYSLPCTMPDLHGIKPGMTKEEAEKQLNQKLSLKKSSIFPNISEVKTAYVNKIKGTDSMSISFYDKVVYDVGVIYDDSIKWKNLAEFAEASSKNLQMPDIQWQYLDKKFQSTSKESAKYASYNCSNFKLFVSHPSNYSLGLMDVDVFARIDKISRFKIQ